MTDSYYKILEVDDNASPEEIKKSYRRLSMLHHPDKNKNNVESTEKFQKISEAYETLSDSEKRKEYDLTRNNPFFNMMGQGAGRSPSMNPMDDLFSNIFGMHFGPGQGPFGPGQGPFGHGPGPFPQQGPGPFGPNIRIFHNGMPMNMNINGQVFGQGIQKPTPIVKTIIVPIDKSLTGTIIPLEIERWLLADNNKVFEKETIYVNIPKGIDEGEIIVLSEKGNINREDCKGDIKIFIKIENNTEFKRSGFDLILEKSITVKEALCGFSFELKYITGKTYTITNNSGNIISNGYKKVIPNMGFSRDQQVGNLIISFNVLFPEKISDESLEQLKKIDF
jgi:DnaJ-class molecular chaperone